ncbi:MAG TPA: PaaI family thioesterase [Polyangiales bacterium]|nr:PaaI family thioesterase [Polyangiales bacterium]
MDELNGKDVANELNKLRGGWAEANGLRFISVTDEETVVELTVADQHLQPYGIVHGGVHAGIIETICSMGAAFAARKRGHKGGVVGLENHTSFIKAVRAGTLLRGTAVPVTRGRTTQVWEAKVTDPQGQVIARGTVRLLCVTENQLPQAPPT